MPEDGVYRELQQDLDRMPVGFPATESGVEIRILKQLFTPLEARIAVRVGMLPETVAVIQRRLKDGLSCESLTEALERMAYCGLIRSESVEGELRFGKLPFVIGIYEGQVDRMSPELARDLMEYFEHGLGQAIRPKATTQLRTVPVNRPIEVERGVAQYDDIRAAVSRCEGPFAVMNCICRQAQDLAGEPCRQTGVRENCLTMGAAARVMLDHGRARPIDRERMTQLLDDADREGLVLQPQNTRNPLFVCCCCGCCCVALKAGKMLERPVEFFSANYFAEVKSGECEACGTCISRCQMDAVSMRDSAASVDRMRCIGCGLCVSTCPSGSMRLHLKPQPAAPPRNTEALYAKIYRERYGTTEYLKAAVRLMAHRAG
jgi:Na+-translocating ferredoxin:NAD+ oxidoreductase subunit B